ncbi:PepSY domain-containing protein [Lysobacter sp. A6]|uniref:PepSY domain-containing protein n=1 Tax=Noviluteimonas lactosilytica TaxID=2888523 RepID=A0ABS8JEF6_9GAMM|nr:PepSY-associated TM helix domain-containing protein [Lysobacter lactosilyticus]MCC8361958.1 PepSY domain-containing protein [Lysobacter lactosilyticus]
MKHNITQSLSWLHTWSGLLVGWLLFVIFAGGTIACFDKELDYWMQPSLHGRATPKIPAFDKAVERLQVQAPEAHSWYLLAGDRDPALQAYTFADDGTETRVALDPETGEPLPSTAGGDFFFELHYNLHAGNLGMYIVGLAGMFAFVAIVAGIFIHKRIFKDFFTFRPAAGNQRAWLDAHNLTGVLGLPFHLLISYTGVIIFATSYMFAGVNAGYGGDINKLYIDAGDFYEREEVGRPLGPMTSVEALLADAQARLGAPVTWASIHHPHDASATIALGGDHDRRVAWNFHQATYDAADGRLLHVTPPPKTAYHAYTWLGGLHMAQFGGSSVRWLYFLLGLAGCVMIASGCRCGSANASSMCAKQASCRVTDWYAR